MVELEDFTGCMIKNDLPKMNLNTYQPYLINKITKGFNKDVK